MKKHRLNFRFLICLLFLIFVAILASNVIYMLWSGQVSDHGEEMSFLFRIIMIILIFSVSLSYLYSSIVMIKQYLVFRGSAFTLSENGIENTLTFINLFAWVFVLPIRKIPWEAVTFIDYSDGVYTVRVKTRMIKASLLAKGIIFIKGYCFCYKFTSAYISWEEIQSYNRHFCFEK